MPLDPQRAAAPKAALDPHGARLLLEDPALFAADARAARRLIDHAFTLAEVRTIALRPERGQIAIDLDPCVDAGQIWRKLAALLRKASQRPDQTGRAEKLDLRGPLPGLPVRVARAGKILTTFRARPLGRAQLRIGHPLLRRREIRLRFEDFLRAIDGVTEIRPVNLWSAVLVSHDPARVEAEQILRLLEGAWPELIATPAAVATPKRLFVATGLLGFAFYAQFLNPALLPLATVAALLYSFPNLVAALREAAQGRVGLPALYATGLGFLLWTRLPFASGVMSTLAQLWPHLAQRLAADSERRLFAERRRRLATARVGDRAIALDELAPGDVFTLRAGDYLPADAVVVAGVALIEEDMLGGRRGAIEKRAGDALFAGAFVRDGALSARTLRAGPATSAAALARALPHGALNHLPSSAEVERIGARNARPALAAAALLLVATRAPRLSQVAIRPDYVIGPRLSAHLSALTALAEALDQGVLIRRPAALERLGEAEIFALDDGLDFSARAVELSRINVVTREAAPRATQWAAAALEGADDPRLLALRRELEALDPPAAPAPRDRRQRVGETSFRDGDALISLLTPEKALSAAFTIPTANLRETIAGLAARPLADPALRPLIVARDHKIIAVLQFDRSGAPLHAEVIAGLRADAPQARVIHLSSAPQRDAEARAAALGFDAVFGGLDALAKRDTLLSLGARVVWIGDGADPSSAPARAASLLSLSLGGPLSSLASLPADEADIVLLHPDLSALRHLNRAAEAHKARLRADYRKVYVANALALAGGVAAGFGSLQAGLTSHAGAAAVFFGRWRGLAQLSRRAEQLAAARRPRTAAPALSLIED